MPATLQRLVVLRERGARPPLVCVHPIGGHVNEYEGLTALLGDDQPVYAIRSRACLAPETEHATVAEMADEYAEIVQSVAGDAPVILFGWSFGALVAHAVACRREESAGRVRAVGMADPLLADSARPADDDPLLAIAMALRIFQTTPVPGHVLRRELRALRPDGLDAAALVKWCESRGLLPTGAVAPEAFDGAIRLFPVHRRLVRTHRPGVCRAPLVLWRGDPRYHRDGYEWSTHTHGAFRHEDVGGTHFTMMSPPHVDAIAADLREVAIERDGVGGSPP